MSKILANQFKKPKRLTICADDFAQNESITQGILDLAAANRINAISCMVNDPYWSEGAASLTQLPTGVSKGLHFNLTHGQPLSHQWRQHHGKHFPSLTQLLGLLFARQLDVSTIQHELLAQWDAFVEKTGCTPDFVDGHQHVHQYGHVRQALTDVFLAKRFQGACRISTNGIKDIFSLDGFPKPMLMWLLGGQILKKKLSRHPVQLNTSFAGFYPFKQTTTYRTHFRKFLAQSRSGGLIMCHPGKISTDKQDPLYPFRINEYLYLMSDAYHQDLKEFGVEH
jgi:predicted glycoside hydrolase/deacetylase ChbG (UPF0249 family)